MVVNNEIVGLRTHFQINIFIQLKSKFREICDNRHKIKKQLLRILNKISKAEIKLNQGYY